MNAARRRETIAIFGGPGAGAMAAQSAGRARRAGVAIRVAGFLNDALTVGDRVSNHPVLGPFAAWRHLPAATRFIAPLHKAKAMQHRAAAIMALGIPASRWTCIVDPGAIVAPDALIGHGGFVGALALIDAAAMIGSHVAVFPGAQIGHDVRLEDFVFVGRNAVVSGRCRIGYGAHVGPGVVVRDGCTVGRFAVIGAGAVVLKDVPDHAIMLGNPARPAGRLDPRDDPDRD